MGIMNVAHGLDLRLSKNYYNAKVHTPQMGMYGYKEYTACKY